MTRSVRLAVAAALASLALIAVGPWLSGQEAPPETAAPETRIPTVPIVVAERRETSLARRFVGRVEPLRTVDIGFQVSGQIVEIAAQEGDFVAEGDLIARLDPVDYELRVERARARDELTAAEYTRVEELARRGVSAEAQLDSSRASRQEAKVALAEAERALRNSRLQAPFDAILVRRMAEEFENVTPASPVLRLQDVSQLLVTISLPEDLAALARAAPGDFTVSGDVAALPGLRLSLTPEKFITEPDPVAQTYEVSFALGEPRDTRLLPGMTVSVEIRRSGDAVPVLVPVSAVDTTSADTPRVWVFDAGKGTVSPRDVRLGLPEGDMVPVLDGLEAQARIVASGWWRLSPGMIVRPARI